MNSFVVKCAFGAAMVGAPVISSGQNRIGVPVRHDVTLLTGPDLLSPPTRPLQSPSVSSEIVAPGFSLSELSLERARKRQSAADERLKKLRAERAAAQVQKQESDQTIKPDSDRVELPTSGRKMMPFPEALRFEGQVPTSNPDLLRFDSTLHSPPPPPRVQFQPAAPKQ